MSIDCLLCINDNLKLYRYWAYVNVKISNTHTLKTVSEIPSCDRISHLDNQVVPSSCVATQPDRPEGRLCGPSADSRTRRGTRAGHIGTAAQASPAPDMQASGLRMAPAALMLLTRCTAGFRLSCLASR